jgi:amidophosphoribosyltransferase
MVSTIDVPFRKLNEYCGVCAVSRTEGEAPPLVHRALIALQHRGQEAAGIASVGPNNEINSLRRRGLVSDCLPTYDVKKLQGGKAIGHVRYSTVALDKSENIQPFLSNTPYGRLAIAHNGNLKNADALREELERDGALLSTTMDTELIVHLIARSGAENFHDALKYAASRMEGAYSLTIICDGRVYGLRDPNGIRPLVLGSLSDGWVIASETCALNAVGATFTREIKRGELVEITGTESPKSTQLLAPAQSAGCVFELVYFARPDSNVFGQGVYASRIRMGEELANQDAKLFEASRPDIVVPIPDSGVPAAIGYARKSGIPFERGIIRSHYIGRTFILPDHDKRSHSVGLKLSVIREAVEGKRVVLVDDSVVRGNTSRLIIQMVRDHGAKEVWMRIASPPIGWPCHLGIDTPSKEELIVNRYESLAEIQESLGVDNLRYLDIEGLKRSTQQGSFCFGCMNGDYPV